MRLLLSRSPSRVDTVEFDSTSIRNILRLKGKR